MSENSRQDTRTIKGISFTNEYKEELELLNNESNASKLVCMLLREYYNKTYSMDELERDVQDIRITLEKIHRKVTKENKYNLSN